MPNILIPYAHTTKKIRVFNHMSTFPFSNSEAPFSVSSQSPTQLEDALAGVLRSLNRPRTPLLASFFSITNLDVIQNRLRGYVQRKTGYAIDRQSDTDLTVIMRKVYGEYANETADQSAPTVAAEVNRLNDVVLGITVPMVASGVAGYLAYLRDASRLPDPLPRGIHTSIKGTKTFELFRAL
jgi:hypothetical protein